MYGRANVPISVTLQDIFSVSVACTAHFRNFLTDTLIYQLNNICSNFNSTSKRYISSSLVVSKDRCSSDYSSPFPQFQVISNPNSQLTLIILVSSNAITYRINQ